MLTRLDVLRSSCLVYRILYRFLAALSVGSDCFCTGVAGAVGRAFRIVARERVAVLVIIAVLLLGFSETRGVPLLFATDALLVAMLAAEHYRVEFATPTA